MLQCNAAMGRAKRRSFVTFLGRITIGAALAGAFWIVPAVGTQGQGTIAARFVHTDQALYGSGDAAKIRLIAADHSVTAAVRAVR
jgi:hypothetical protein